MDNLVEQVVKREKNTKYYLTIVLIVLFAVLIPVTFIILGFAVGRAYLVLIGFFASLFCVYGAWYFCTCLNVDYEYACLSGTFRVDKIIAKRKRKKVLKLEVKQIEDMFKYSDEQMSKQNFKKVYNVASVDFSDNNVVVVFYTEGKQKNALVFEPNENMLQGMRPYLKREIVREFF